MCYNDKPVHTEEYLGHTIEIWQDEFSRDPWKEEDGNPPLAVYSDRDITEYGESVNCVPELTREQIKANIKAICDLCNVKTVFALNRLGIGNDDVYENIREAIAQHVDDLGYYDRLKALCDLYNMTGQPALLKSVTGYSQGQWAQVLAVATTQFQADHGDVGYWQETNNLKSAIQLWADWCYGNVYGYKALDADGEEIEDGSCWGFFGDYDRPYGALHEAEAAINWRVSQDRKKYIEQLKTWIRNRVPLQYRTSRIWHGQYS